MTAVADGVRGLTGSAEALTLDGMASGLSEQLTHVQNALNAVSAKGAAVPESAKLSSLAGLIESLSDSESSLFGFEIDCGSFTPGEDVSGGYTVETRFTTGSAAPRSDIVICFLDNEFSSAAKTQTQSFCAGIYIGNVYSCASSAAGNYKEDAVGFYFNSSGQKAYLTTVSNLIEFIIGDNGGISFKVSVSSNARLLAGCRYRWIYIRRALDW